MKAKKIENTLELHDARKGDLSKINGREELVNFFSVWDSGTDIRTIKRTSENQIEESYYDGTSLVPYTAIKGVRKIDCRKGEGGKPHLLLDYDSHDKELKKYGL